MQWGASFVQMVPRTSDWRFDASLPVFESVGHRIARNAVGSLFIDEADKVRRGKPATELMIDRFRHRPLFGPARFVAVNSSL
jgi:hypothetical protein